MATTQQILDESTKVANEAARVSGQSFTPGYDKNYQPINSNLLQSSGTPLQFPTPTESQAPSLLGYTESLSSQFAKDMASAESALSKQGEATGKSLNDYLTAYLGQAGPAALAEQSRQAEGVDTARQELNDINNQIIAEQVALQRQIEAIEKNPEGKFGGAIADDIRLAQRQSASKQADLSVIQMARQGRYDSAREMADRAVAIKLESQKQNLDALQFFYTENKSLFDKAEQRLFETRQKERERVLANDEFRLRAQYEQTIRENDPAYRLALRTGESNLLTDQAQRAKIFADIAGGGSGAAKPFRSGTLIYTAQDFAEDSQALDASRGDDGFVDPSLYLELYKAWIDEDNGGGGRLEDFLSKFPPENYINPENEWLPFFLMPPKKETSGIANPFK